MVILGKWQGQSLTVSVKPSCLTISMQRPEGAEVYSFDGEGRLWTAMRNGISYRRGLDGKVVAKWGMIADSRERRWLDSTEARRLEEQAWAIATRLAVSIRAGEAVINSPFTPEAEALFQAVANFDSSRAARDTSGYLQVYKPVGILPPDQYMAVVLQMTEGCSFNTCTFCNFYRDRPFRIKTPDEFSQHIDLVKAYLGAGFSLRRTIFLGDANALVVPMSRLVPLVDRVNQAFDVEAIGGIYAFLDGFSGEKKSRADYVELRKRGLKRVYIGMESGNDALLQFLKKPGSAADVIQTALTIKEAGLAVGIIALLGAGGHTYAEGHVRDTIQANNKMELGLDDIIYFSELIEHENMPYVRDAYLANLRPLSPQERLQQGEQIEAGLNFTEERGTPHISRYDIREFVY
jgi:radical SAM superfamily enzyme YgiQ (UPF0313 family)